MHCQLTRTTAIATTLVALFGAAILVWYRFPHLTLPTYGLTLATGPEVQVGKPFIDEFMREAHEAHPHVKFHIVKMESTAAAGQALKDRKADFAVVRSDNPIAGEGRTIVLLRKLAVILMTEPNSKIDNPRALQGKKIGIPADIKDDRLLKAVTDFYGFKAADLVNVPPADAGKLLKEKKIAAYLGVGPITRGPLLEAITSIRKIAKEQPTFIDLDDAETFVKNYPLYETLEIGKGEMSGSPATPEDSIDTVGVTVRLISRASLPDRVAGEVTKAILATKTKLVTSFPAVGQVSAPATDDDNPILPIHPGTVKFLKGEQASLVSLITDHVYEITLVGGLIASIFGWLMSALSLKKPEMSVTLLDRLTALRRKIAAPDFDAEAAERELAEIEDALTDLAVSKSIEGSDYLAVTAVVDRTRQTIERKKAAPKKDNNNSKETALEDATV